MINVFMRKYTVLFVLSVFIFAGCGSQKDLTSHYAAEPVHVDGTISEWMDKLSYDKGQSIYYSVANDNSNLYLVLMTNDQVVQRKIMGLGLTLWFDNEGKKNKTKGIRNALLSIFPTEQGGICCTCEPCTQYHRGG